MVHTPASLARTVALQLGLLAAWYGGYRALKPSSEPLFPEAKYAMVVLEHTHDGRCAHMSWPAPTFGELVFPIFYLTATLCLLLVWRMRRPT